MRPGVTQLVMGVLLLGAGIAVTVLSTQVFWYGAIVVGVIQIARGAYMLLRSA
jgi:hypothetical protein